MSKPSRKKKTKLPPGIKQAMAVVFMSPTGRAPWVPVKPEDVPAWVKDPDVMAKLLSGEEAMKCDEGVKGSPYYRAIRINQSMKADH